MEMDIPKLPTKRKRTAEISYEHNVRKHRRLVEYAAHGPGRLGLLGTSRLKQ